MKIMFHTNTLNYRGTSVAVTDYAKYNQEILGNESVISYCKTFGNEKDMGNEPHVIDSLRRDYNVIGYDTGRIQNVIEENKIDLCYIINSGKKENIPTNCRTAVHAVFQYNEPHGDRYAYISKWLSDTVSDGSIPYVPHIVDLPDTQNNYREFFNIKQDQTVIGRIGGYYTFDLNFVKKFIVDFVEKNPNYVFLFVGTAPFANHPNIKYFDEIHSKTKKSMFINTCDAMIHARQRGESFGLSIAEFLSKNKPVIAWADGHDRNHIEMLEDSNTLYSDERDLKNILLNIKDITEQQDWSWRTREYNPQTVMDKFKEVFYD